MPLYSAISGDAEGNDIRRPGSATSSNRGSRYAHCAESSFDLKILVLSKSVEAVANMSQAALQSKQERSGNHGASQLD